MPAAYESYLAAAPYLRRYEKVENLDKAISLLKEAVKADPDFALAFAALGEAYRRKFDITQDQSLLTEAESNASRALQLNDSLARVHIVMGGVHRELGRRELAQQEFLTAIKLEPNNADALSELAGEYGASQRVPDAERLYRQAVALKPDSWGIYNDYGRISDDSGQARGGSRAVPDGDSASSGQRGRVPESGYRAAHRGQTEGGGSASPRGPATEPVIAGFAPQPWAICTPNGGFFTRPRRRLFVALS